MIATVGMNSRSRWTTSDIGSVMRGKLRLCTSAVLDVIDFAPAANVDEKNWNMKMPMMRNSTKLGGRLPAEQEAEDQSVDGGLEQGLEDDPQHAEAVALVLGLDAELSQRDDELAACPHLAEVGTKRWTRTDSGETARRHVIGEVHLEGSLL